MRWFAAGCVATAVLALTALLAAIGTALTLAFADDPDEEEDQETP